MSIQFKCLADGTDSADLYGPSSDLLFLATVAIMDVFGKGSNEFDSLDGGDIGELRVHMMEGCNEVCPMVPIALPFFVICCHDASIDALSLSSEKTTKVILELRWKLHSEVSCKGKVELNKCAKSHHWRWQMCWELLCCELLCCSERSLRPCQASDYQCWW